MGVKPITEISREWDFFNQLTSPLPERHWSVNIGDFVLRVHIEFTDDCQRTLPNQANRLQCLSQNNTDGSDYSV